MNMETTAPPATIAEQLDELTRELDKLRLSDEIWERRIVPTSFGGVVAELTLVGRRQVESTTKGNQGAADMKNDVEYQHLLAKVRHARDGGYDVLSTGEKLVAALVLNRFDWLQATGYTMAQAVERVGAEWVSMLSQAERDIADDEVTE
ncbi:hypothetical protein RA280_14795 [Cupriavidus sp. CV2]|uniref:hypothetical protein n=1 Tax=Cupriavidus ulmosensis TaxID=3065913 RepID=UPI00296B3475|nr:hypothetical protein [Cupriavidus sp. CV2]MDW3682993.1 hypothetical protein [Cupriavidus sp. CV2]